MTANEILIAVVGILIGVAASALQQHLRRKREATAVISWRKKASEVILLAFFIGGALIDLYSGVVAAVFAWLFGAVLPVLLLAAGMYGLGVALPIGMAIAITTAIVATLAIIWWRSERREQAEAQR